MGNLDNLKRIYWEVSSASINFEVSFEEIIKMAEIELVTLDIRKTNLSIEQQKQIYKKIKDKKYNIVIILSSFEDWDEDIFALASNITMVINDDIGALDYIKTLEAEKKAKINIVIEVCNENYQILEELIYQIYSIGVKNVELNMTQRASKMLTYINVFNVIKTYTSIKDIFPNISLSSDLKKIERYIYKGIIEDAFINYEGYVGILSCLPTYYENINKISFDVALERYLKLYFYQDIKFYKTRLGTVENINNMSIIRDEIFKYGFYNMTIPAIKKNWNLQYSKTDIYFFDSVTGNKIKLNNVAVSLLTKIDGNKSIKEIVDLVSQDYEDKSRIYFDCIGVILRLLKEKVLYSNVREEVKNEDTTNK